MPAPHIEVGVGRKIVMAKASPALRQVVKRRHMERLLAGMFAAASIARTNEDLAK